MQREWNSLAENDCKRYGRLCSRAEQTRSRVEERCSYVCMAGLIRSVNNKFADETEQTNSSESKIRSQLKGQRLEQRVREEEEKKKREEYNLQIESSPIDQELAWQAYITTLPTRGTLPNPPRERKKKEEKESSKRKTNKNTRVSPSAPPSNHNFEPLP